MLGWLKKRWFCPKTRLCTRAVVWPILLASALLIWLGAVGLPPWALRRFEASLSENGIPLKSAKAQFDLVNGLTLRGVQFGSSEASQVSFDRVVVRLRWDRAIKGHFDPVGLRLEGGVASMQLPGSAAAPLRWTRLQGDLQRRGERDWDLSSLVARSGALELRLEGVMRHPSQFLDWVDRAFPSETEFDWKPLLQAYESLNRLPFEEPIRLTVSGFVDGDRIAEADFAASLRVPDVVAGGWGVAGARLALNAPPVKAGSPKSISVDFRANRYQDPSRLVEDLRLSGRVSCDPEGLGLLGATASAEARSYSAEPFWIEDIETGLQVVVDDSGVSWSDLSHLEFGLDWDVTADRVGGASATLENVRIIGDYRPEQGASLSLESDRIERDGLEGSGVALMLRATGPRDGGLRGVFQPETGSAYSGKATINEVHAKNFSASSLRFDGDWGDEQGANLRFAADRGGQPLIELSGALQAAGPWSVSGATHLNISDLLAIAPSVAEGGIAAFEFESAPTIRFDWEAPRGPEVESGESILDWALTLGQLTGQATSGPGAFRGVEFQGATAELSLLDGLFEASDVGIERAEGEISLTYRQKISEAAYEMDVSGRVHAAALKGLFGPETQQVFDHFEVEKPIVARGVVTGPWETGEGTVDVHIAGKDWIIREVPFDTLETRLVYADDAVRLTDLSMQHATGPVSASRIDVALEDDFAVLEGVVSLASPREIAALFDEEDLELFDLLKFYNQPTVRCDGRVDFRGETIPDLKFQVDGRRGLFGRYFIDSYTGALHWTGEEVWLRDFLAACYQGTATGTAVFDLRENVASDLAFSLQVEALELQRVLRDAVDDGSLTGRLDGSLDVVSGRMEDEDTWKGSGLVKVREGRLIDEPIFGLVSTLLNRVAPGLGNIRATRAGAQFVLDQGVVRTGNLEIAGAQVGLNYRGTIGLDGAVMANAEAFLFDDRELIGKVGNLTLMPLAKTFTFRITGHVSEPNVEPLFLIPKILVAPLKPIETLDKLLPFDLPFR